MTHGIEDPLHLVVVVAAGVAMEATAATAAVAEATVAMDTDLSLDLIHKIWRITTPHRPICSRQ